MKIKNTLSIAALSTLLATSTLQADTFLGTDIEAGMWLPSYETNTTSGAVSGEDSSFFASATIEHAIPILPNLKLSLSNVESTAYEYTKIDYTAFYEILDNDIISIDVGMGASQYQNGKYLNQAFSGVLPHSYMDAEVSLPLTSTTLYTDIHYLNYDDNSVIDAIAGLRYDFNLVAADIGLKAGYRVQSIDVESLDNLAFDIKTDGYFIGLHADF